MQSMSSLTGTPHRGGEEPEGYSGEIIMMQYVGWESVVRILF